MQMSQQQHREARAMAAWKRQCDKREMESLDAMETQQRKQMANFRAAEKLAFEREIEEYKQKHEDHDSGERHAHQLSEGQTSASDDGVNRINESQDDYEGFAPPSTRLHPGGSSTAPIFEHDEQQRLMDCLAAPCRIFRHPATFSVTYADGGPRYGTGSLHYGIIRDRQNNYSEEMTCYIPPQEEDHLQLQQQFNHHPAQPGHTPQHHFPRYSEDESHSRPSPAGYFGILHAPTFPGDDTFPASSVRPYEYVALPTYHEQFYDTGAASGEGDYVDQIQQQRESWDQNEQYTTPERSKEQPVIRNFQPLHNSRVSEIFFAPIRSLAVLNLRRSFGENIAQRIFVRSLLGERKEGDEGDE